MNIFHVEAKYKHSQIGYEDNDGISLPDRPCTSTRYVQYLACYLPPPVHSATRTEFQIPEFQLAVSLRSLRVQNCAVFCTLPGTVRYQVCSSTVPGSVACTNARVLSQLALSAIRPHPNPRKAHLACARRAELKMNTILFTRTVVL
jgi:hypothetical protein